MLPGGGGMVKRRRGILPALAGAWEVPRAMYPRRAETGDRSRGDHGPKSAFADSGVEDLRDERRPAVPHYARPRGVIREPRRTRESRAGADGRV